MVDTSEGTQFGDMATYTCSDGFEFAMNPASAIVTRMCLMDEEWSGAEPECIES